MLWLTVAYAAGRGVEISILTWVYRVQKTYGNNKYEALEQMKVIAGHEKHSNGGFQWSHQAQK